MRSKEVTEMGYRTAELPPVDLDEFAKIPFFERMKMLQLHWVEHGFGTPKQTVTFYVWKIFYYGLFGLICAGAFTKGLEFNNIAGWWDEPILYQKLMVWTILLEIMGLAATCGPLAFHFDPPIGGDLVLVAERHHAGAAVPEPCAVHQGQPAHAMGHRAVQADRVLADHDAVPLGQAGRRPARRQRRNDAAMGAGHLLLPDPADGDCATRSCSCRPAPSNTCPQCCASGCSATSST